MDCEPSPPTLSTEPLLKWVGGKRQLLPTLLPLVPYRPIRYYLEPFFGSGALFFALAKRIQPPTEALLCDLNPHLVNFYRQVNHDPHGLYLLLKGGKARYDADPKGTYALWAKELSPSPSSPEQAVIFYGLNRGGFNGLWRVNLAGKYNTAWGKHDTLYLPPLESWVEVKRSFKTAQWHNRDSIPWLEQWLPRLTGEDFVYLDPPYCGTFDRYQATKLDHERLASLFGDLVERGIPAMLSNSDTEETRSIYQGIPFLEVKALRRVNRDGKGRGATGELVFLSGVDPEYAQLQSVQ